MRILGFSRKWEKLNKQTFTTFRFPRKDRDWDIGEKVQVVYRPRSKEREVLFIADIINKEPRGFSQFIREDCCARSEIEAIEDGFENREAMIDFLYHAYGERIYQEKMNRLTLSRNGVAN